MFRAHSTQSVTPICLATVALIGLCVGSSSSLPAYAESLYRGGIAYQTAQAYTPRSLFAMQRPASVGDMITININETTNVNAQNTTTLEKKRTMNETSTSVINSALHKIFNFTNILPSVDGINNDDKNTITGTSQKQYTYTDSITCQVVQVLPNGFFVVQGKKSLNANKEQQDLIVTGVVNPYYLDSNNSIASTQVANLQMNVVGHGIMSRQQGDGVLGKYMQYIN